MPQKKTTPPTAKVDKPGFDFAIFKRTAEDSKRWHGKTKAYTKAAVILHAARCGSFSCQAMWLTCLTCLTCANRFQQGDRKNEVTGNFYGLVKVPFGRNEEAKAAISALVRASFPAVYPLSLALLPTLPHPVSRRASVHFSRSVLVPRASARKAAGTRS